MTTNTSTEEKVESLKYEVCRLDIRTPPGWFRMHIYNNERDALIYCDMMNTDTNMVHRVFEVSDD